jgi:hypothetical protein
MVTPAAIRNPFDWEVWHECDVFRAEVIRRLAGKS